MIKDLLTPITNTPGDGNAVAAALALSAREDAHLVLLEVVNLPLPAPSPWGLLPDLAMNDIYNGLRAKAQTDAAAWRERLAREAISFEVRVVESAFAEPPATAALQARHCDLTVMTAATGDGNAASVIHDYFTALLMESGRPLLLVPPGFTTHRAARRAVVAWRPTSDATRALHDALPLLRQAQSVDVVQVDPSAGDGIDGPPPDAAIATHLARHGVDVRMVALARHGQTVAEALITHVTLSGADLLVAGGYGHSRFRQWLLGGVTRDLLRSVPVPVLFSH